MLERETDERGMLARCDSLVSQVADKAADACPWLLLGILTTVLLQSIKLPTGRIRGLLTLPAAAQSGGAASKLAGTLWVSLVGCVIGLVTPLCSCGALPLAIGLAGAGAAPSAVVAFLTAAQSAGIDSAAMTLGILGVRATAFRLAGAAVLAIAAGVAIGPMQGSAASSSDAATTATATKAESASSSPLWRRKPAALVRTVLGLFEDIWFPIFLGIVTTVAVEVFWSADRVSSLIPPPPAPPAPPATAPEGWDEEEDGVWRPDDSGVGEHGSATAAAAAAAVAASPLVAALAGLVLRVVVVVGSLPIQLCEHGVVNFAAALETAGAPAGLTFAFLLSAPATNASALAVIVKTVGGNALAAVRSAAALAVTAIAMSYAVDAAVANGLDVFGSSSSASSSSTPPPPILTAPEGWDEEEDGVWRPGDIDTGADTAGGAAQGGGSVIGSAPAGAGIPLPPWFQRVSVVLCAGLLLVTIIKRVGRLVGGATASVKAKEE
eukprot:g1255.t1